MAARLLHHPAQAQALGHPRIPGVLTVGQDDIIREVDVAPWNIQPLKALHADLFLLWINTDRFQPGIDLPGSFQVGIVDEYFPKNLERYHPVGSLALFLDDRVEHLPVPGRYHVIDALPVFKHHGILEYHPVNAIGHLLGHVRYHDPGKAMAGQDEVAEVPLQDIVDHGLHTIRVGEKIAGVLSMAGHGRRIGNMAVPVEFRDHPVPAGTVVHGTVDEYKCEFQSCLLLNFICRDCRPVP